MKLYYAPFSCSLSPHIVLLELGLPFDLVKVNNKTKETSDNRNFLTINPKGYVPVLELDNGELLTEGPVIVQYLADLKPEKELAPANGTWERVRLQEWLNFITTEMHAKAVPMILDTLSEDAKKVFREMLFKRLNYLEGILGQQPYLMGETYTVADAYLFTTLGWCKFFKVDLKQWPALVEYVNTIKSRPAVHEALKYEATT